MPAVIHDIAEYAALAALAIVAVYIAARVGTLGVMRSIADFRRHQEEHE